MTYDQCLDPSATSQIDLISTAILIPWLADYRRRLC